MATRKNKRGSGQQVTLSKRQERLDAKRKNNKVLRTDPTQSITLRNAFASFLRRKWNRLKRQITFLVVEHNAFGLNTGNAPPLNPFTNASPSLLPIAITPTIAINQGRWESRTSPEKVREFQEWLERRYRANLLREAREFAAAEATREIIEIGEEDEEDDGGDDDDFTTQSYRDYVEEGYRKGAGQAYDRVNQLQDVKDMTARGKRARRLGAQGRRALGATELVGAYGVAEVLDEDDVEEGTSFLGLGGKKKVPVPSPLGGTGPGATASQAMAQAEFIRGQKEGFIRTTLGSPISRERLDALVGRVFTDIKGVTAAVSTQMTRVLADGLVQGRSPRLIARDLNKVVDTIGIRRSELIARTEVVRSLNEGALTAYENMGVQELGVMVELTPTNDTRTCPLCADLRGMVVKINEARGMLPRHAACRCAWIPANVGEKQQGQKRTKESIDKAITKSAKREGGRDKTKWIGADKKIAKERPADQVKEFIKEQLQGEQQSQSQVGESSTSTTRSFPSEGDDED